MPWSTRVPSGLPVVGGSRGFGPPAPPGLWLRCGIGPPMWSIWSTQKAARNPAPAVIGSTEEAREGMPPKRRIKKSCWSTTTSSPMEAELVEEGSPPSVAGALLSGGGPGCSGSVFPAGGFRLGNIKPASGAHGGADGLRTYSPPPYPP